MTELYAIYLYKNLKQVDTREYGMFRPTKLTSSCLSLDILFSMQYETLVFFPLGNDMPSKFSWRNSKTSRTTGLYSMLYTKCVPNIEVEPHLVPFQLHATVRTLWSHTTTADSVLSTVCTANINACVLVLVTASPSSVLYWAEMICTWIPVFIIESTGTQFWKKITNRHSDNYTCRCKINDCLHCFIQVHLANFQPSSAAEKVSIVCGMNIHVKSEMLSNRRTDTQTHRQPSLRMRAKG